MRTGLLGVTLVGVTALVVGMALLQGPSQAGPSAKGDGAGALTAIATQDKCGKTPVAVKGDECPMQAAARLHAVSMCEDKAAKAKALTADQKKLVAHVKRLRADVVSAQHSEKALLKAKAPAARQAAAKKQVAARHAALHKVMIGHRDELKAIGIECETFCPDGATKKAGNAVKISQDAECAGCPGKAAAAVKASTNGSCPVAAATKAHSIAQGDGAACADKAAKAVHAAHKDEACAGCPGGADKVKVGEPIVKPVKN